MKEPIDYVSKEESDHLISQMMDGLPRAERRHRAPEGMLICILAAMVWGGIIGALAVYFGVK